MKKKLYKYFPPGVDVKKEIGIISGILISAVLLTIYWFIVNFISARNTIVNTIKDEYDFWEHSENPIFRGKFMPDFLEVVDNMRMPVVFLLLAVGVFVFFSIYNYSFYFKGSKNVYLMKRLPNPREIYRRAFAVPLVSACIYIAVMIGLFFLFYTLYMKIIPDDHILMNQWEKIWREII